jgi:hypothetical protein
MSFELSSFISNFEFVWSSSLENWDLKKGPLFPGALHLSLIFRQQPSSNQAIILQIRL